MHALPSFPLTVATAFGTQLPHHFSTAIACKVFCLGISWLPGSGPGARISPWSGHGGFDPGRGFLGPDTSSYTSLREAVQHCVINTPRRHIDILLLKMRSKLRSPKRKPQHSCEFWTSVNLDQAKTKRIPIKRMPIQHQSNTDSMVPGAGAPLDPK